jgi:hypothetical protein
VRFFITLLLSDTRGFREVSHYLRSKRTARDGIICGVIRISDHETPYHQVKGDDKDYGQDDKNAPQTSEQIVRTSYLLPFSGCDFSVYVRVSKTFLRTS